MPLIKSKMKSKQMAMMDDEGGPAPGSGNSLPMALSIQRKNKPKKMAGGGPVVATDPEKKKTLGETIGYPMAEGGEIERCSPAEMIMRKRRAARMAEGGMVDLEEGTEEHGNMEDDLSWEALGKELYDDEQISEQPTDSNEHSDEIESDTHDKISQMRARIRAKRGM